MRHVLPLAALVLAGCPPSSASSGGAAATASVAPVVTGVLYADGPEVRAATFVPSRLRPVGQTAALWRWLSVALAILAP